jgi:N-alpha-acetyl-L-2,4-diaminobutyrate deacetylase
MNPLDTPRASLTIALDAPGKQLGHIALAWSRNESAWGSLRIPVAVFNHGVGPTVLVVGGNHGDEFEGPIVINDFIRRANLEQVKGRIICMPALNYPALKAGTRLSPIDQRNMNRAFRRLRNGTITEQIAHFVEDVLVESAEAVLDIHAGGRTMMFQPFAASHRLADETQAKRARQALGAFGAPIGLVVEELDAEGMLDTAVERRGKLFLSTELGGGGSTTPETVRLARHGLHNFLVHTGVLDADPIPPQGPVRLMRTADQAYVIAERSGLIEFTVALGDTVRRGDVIGYVHDCDHLDMPRDPIYAPDDGVLLGRLHGGLVGIGDFLALVGRDL